MSFEFVQGIHLQRTDETIDEIDALAELCDGRVGIDGVLADLDRQAKGAFVPGFKAGRGLTWDRHDRGTRRWWPQGISTSADASDTEDIGGRRCVAVSWYATNVGGIGKGTRITFLDLDAKRYRHVLLVRPVMKDDQVGIEPLRAHAGGIVWCGPYLHIAATKTGIYTARIDDLVRVPDRLHDPDHTRFGRHDDKLSTHNYRYLLPIRFSYKSFNDDGHDPMRYSFLSLDRSVSPPELVAGEYGRRGQTTRLVRYPLDPTTYHLVSGEDGFARPLLLEEQGARGMQGAAIVRGRWYITSSRGPLGLGALYDGTPGRFRRRRWALPMGPEDISYWPSTDTLWSVTEHPWRRWVYPVKRAQFD